MSRPAERAEYRPNHQEDADSHQRHPSVVEQVVVGMGEKIYCFRVSVGCRVVKVGVDEGPAASAAHGDAG
jgi:hypothetical protein